MTEQRTDDHPLPAGDDERPRVWLGHLGPLPVPDLGDAEAFYATVGCRLVTKVRDLAIFELRGGTHLIVQQATDPTAGPAPFDLMVDDLDAAHRDYQAAGLAPSTIVAGSIHRSFTVVDPAGHVITVNDSHVTGPV